MLKILTKIFPHFFEVWHALRDNPIYLQQARKKYCRTSWFRINFSLPVILKGFPGLMELEWKTGKLNHARLTLMSQRDILLGYIMPRVFGTIRLILTFTIITAAMILLIGTLPWLKKHIGKIPFAQLLLFSHAAVAIGIQLIILSLLFFLDNFRGSGRANRSFADPSNRPDQRFPDRIDFFIPDELHPGNSFRRRGSHVHYSISVAG